MADEPSFNERVIEQFRANAGAVTLLYPDSTLVLVTLRGKKSGREITLPLEFIELDGVLHLFATAAGSARNPTWYHNLRANPRVTVETGHETFSAVARQLHGAERDRAWRAVVTRKPRFGEYEQKTDRLIPVFALERAKTDA
jgi:deazaflavin-dependent oxidoreductase (nitroreductase family)